MLERLWHAVDGLVDRAAGLEDLRSHGLDPFAARRLRQLGRKLSADLEAREHLAAVRTLAAPLLLRRVREAYDGPLLVLKGPELAARYPSRTLRPFGDVDVLVEDAAAVQRALGEGGFEEIGDPGVYRDIHHLRPLCWPGLPLRVEVHSRPKWLDSFVGPPLASIFRDAVPATVEADGFLAPSPAQHAVLASVHSWAHEPLRRLRDLVDVAVLAAEAERGEIAEIAEEWGVERLWATTIAAVDSVFYGGSRPAALHLWARGLGRVRERTVLENHVERWLSPFSILPPGRALLRLPATLADEIGKAKGEPWRRKLERTSLAFRNALRRRSEHHAQLHRAQRSERSGTNE